MVAKVEINLAMKSEIEVMDGVETLLDGRDILCLITVCHHLLVQVTLGAAVGVLEISGNEQSESFLPEAVADRDAGIDVGHRHGVAGHLRASVFEIFSGSVVGAAISFVRSFGSSVAAFGTEIVIADVAKRCYVLVTLPEEVVGTDGSIGLEPKLSRSVLHVHVNDTTGSVTLHIGGERFGYYETVHEVGGE